MKAKANDEEGRKDGMGKIMICLLLVLLFAIPASGEYYQYKDAQGNLRFTDDIANIPEKERADVHSFESVESDTSLIPPDIEDSVSTEEASIDGDKQVLETMQKELDLTARSINEQKQDLEAQKPADDSSNAEKKAYFDKVNSLNAEIEEYTNKRQAYDEKAKDYNANLKLKKKSE